MSNTDPDLTLKINAVVDGIDNVKELVDELRILSDAAHLQIPDNSEGLRDGAVKTGAVFKSLQDEIHKVVTVSNTLTAAASYIKAASSEAMAYDTRMRALEATIHATGGAAGLSADQIRNFSEQLAFNTLASVESVEKAANSLLTFKSISGDTFKETLTLSQDLAQAGFGSLESNAILLGEALQNPVQGLSLLSSAGVSFTGNQQALIQSLMQTGQEAQAQALMLKSVADEVGGVGEAAAQGLAGSLDKLGHQFETVQKATGDVINPALKTGIDALSESIVYLQEHFGTIAKIAEDAGIVLVSGLAQQGLRAANSLKTSMAQLVSSFVATAKEAGSLSAMIKKIPTNIQIMIAVAGFMALKEAATAAAELAAKHSEAGQAAEAAQKKAQEQMQATLNRQIDLINANERYKDTVVLSASEVAKMGTAEREDYVTRLNGAKKYHVAVAMADYAQQQLHTEVIKGGAESRKALIGLRQGIEAVAEASNMTREQVKNLLSIDAQTLISQFDQTLKVSQNVGKALSEIVKNADFSHLDGIQAFGQALVSLKTQGKISADQVKQGWSESLSKLSSEDLANFAINANAAFNSGARDATAQSDAMTAAVSEAAKRAGVDLETAFGGVSVQAQKSMSHVDALSSVLISAGKTAQQIEPAMEMAMGNAIDSAKTEDDIDALKNKLGELQKQHVVSAETTGRLTEKITEQQAKIQQSIPGIQSLDESFAKLGISSQKVLQQQADAAKAAYDAISSGGTTLGEQQAAFNTYAAAAIKANGGIADSSLYAEAAQVGMADALKRSQISVINALPAVQTLSDEYKRSADSASANTKATQDYGNEQINAAQAALELAKSQGDENAVARANIDLSSAKIAASRNVADAKQREADVARAYVDQLRNQLAADGEITAADEAVIAQAKKNADSKQQEASAAEKAANAEQEKANVTHESAAASREAETATSGYQAAINNQIASVEEYNKSLAENINLAITQGQSWYGTATAIKDLSTVNDNTTLGTLKAELQDAGAAAKQAEQDMSALSTASMITAHQGFASVLGAIAAQKKAAAEAAVENLNYQIALEGIKVATDNGSLSLSEQRDQLVALSHNYRNLDAATLNQLKSQIDEVNHKLTAMQDQATATLQSLQEELANQQGDYATAAEIEAKQKILKLQQQIEEARTAGNAAAVESLQKALEIQAKLNATALAEAKAKEQQAKADANKPKTASSSSSTTTTTSSNSGGGASPAPAAAGAPPVNIHIGGVLDVNDRTTLDSLARKLQPVFTDLARRGAV
jgi:hypothetical protein